MITLKSPTLTVQCKPEGAELTSIQGRDGIEYLWQADPQVWGRHAPVLFPVVGKLSENQYRLKGNTYPMSQHGFARDRVFKIAQQTDNAVTFRLSDSQDTQQMYPYKFMLEIAYTLEGNTLSVGYTIYNQDKEAIFATIGGHPAFTCPLPNLGKRSDYQLVFEQVESAGTHLLENGNFSGETVLALDNTKILPIDDHLFDHDALVFKELISNSVTLQHKSGKRVVTMNFADFPYLGIWSKNQTAPFVCIEPWIGLADTKDFKGDFTQKEGMQRIEEGDRVAFSYQMHFGD